jgi:hypothetical protein
MPSVTENKIAVVEATNTTRWHADLEKLLERYPELAAECEVSSGSIKGDWKKFIFKCWLRDQNELFHDVSRSSDVCAPECWTEARHA